MDLKGRDPASLPHGGARLRVWYEEEASPGAAVQRTCYTGHVTSYIPRRGLRVWFDGFAASEQEWVDENDEWEWEESPDSSSQPSDALPAPDGYSRVVLKLRQTNGKSLVVGLPTRSFAAIAPEENPLTTRSSSPRRFNKKARLLGAVAANTADAESSSPVVPTEAEPEERPNATQAARPSKRAKRETSQPSTKGKAAELNPNSKAKAAIPRANVSVETHRLRISGEGIQLVVIPANNEKRVMRTIGNFDAKLNL
ncbi:MAG: hypothetical protein SGPRY_010195, partial [Prymnesium sp.]